MLDVVGHLLDQLMDRFQLGRSRLSVGHLQAVVAEEEAPKLLEEAVYTVNTIGVPRLGLLDRAQEHLIETQGVGSIFLDNHIGVDHVEHRLRHLFDCPSADVLAILQDELRIVILRSPLFEGIHVEHVIADNIDIHMDRSHLIILLEVVGDKGVGAVDAIDEVRSSLDHTLVDELLKGLLLTNNAQIKEELVPETAVNQVTGSVLRTSNVEINIAPVLIYLRIYQSMLVVRIHVTQIVSG